jgi:hypothetical protein
MFATIPFFAAVPTLMEYLITCGVCFVSTAVLFVVVGIYGDDEDTPSIAIIPDKELYHNKKT